MAGLHFDITADNRNFMRALNEISDGVRNASRQIEQEGVNIEEFFNRIRNISAISFAGFGLGEMVSKISSTRAYFQDIESSMKVFLGDAEKAAAFTEELQKAAYYNMYDFAQLADASKQLIAYGNDVEDVTDIIQKLSEVGVATGQQLGDMVNLYNKAKATGVVDGNALDSWAAKGLLVKDMLKEMGTYAEGQTVTFKQLNEVLDKATAEGGLFHGIQDSMMENINSNLGQLEDQMGLMFNDIGQELEEPINWALKRTSELMDHWKEIGFTMAAVIASAGLQKGVELVTTTVDKTATQAMYAAEQAQLQALLPLKEEEEKTSLQQAVASGHLTEAKAAEIQALRESVEEYSKVLADKEADAEKLAKTAETFAEEMRIMGEELISQNTEEIDSLQEKIEANKEWLESLDENIQWMYEDQIATENATLAEQINTLETENNSIQTEINSAAEASNAASRNLAAVSAQREAVAVGIETSATAKSTFATRVLITAKTMLTKVQAKLNAVIAANPYAVALAAIMALAYGINYLCNYESEAAKRAREVEEANKRVADSYAKEETTLDKLFEKLKSAKKGTDEWKAAKDSIVSQYGQYFSNLDMEIEKTRNLDEVYKQLAKSIRDSISMRGMKDFYDKIDNSGERMEKWSDFAEEFKKKSGLTENAQNVILPLIEDYVKKGGETADNVLKHIEISLLERGKSGGILFDSIKRKLQKYDFRDVTELHQQSKNEALQLKAFQQNNGLSEEQVNEALFGLKPPKEYEERRTEEKVLADKIKGLKDKWHNADKTTEEGKKLRAETEAEIKKLEEEYNSRFGKTYDQENKKKSGPSAEQLAAKEENAEGKLADVIRRQAVERKRLEQDHEHERWQSRIDLMEDGEAKILAQEKLNFDKERLALQRRKEQEIEAELQRQMALFDAEENVKAAADKKYAKKTFRDSDINQEEFDKINSRYKELEADLTDTQRKAEADRLDAAKESMNAYLREFGTYQEKRLSLQEEYETKISEAQNEGERMMLMGQRNKALADLDYDEWIGTGEIALAFGDVEKLSDSTVSKLIKDMEKYRDKVISTFDPEKIQQYEEALANLRNVDMNNSFGAFASYMPDYFKQRKSVGNQMDSSGETINKLHEERGEILSRILDLKERIANVDESGEDVAKLNEELEEAEVAYNANGNAIKKAMNAFRQLQEQWDSLNTPEAKFYALCGAVSAVTDVISPLVSQMSEMMDAMGASGLASALGTLGEAMDSVGNIASGFSQGGLVGGIASAAGEVMKWTTKLFMAGDNRKQRNIERLQEQIDALNKSYEKLSNAAEDAFSTDASALIEQQNTLLQQQKVLIRQQMAEEQSKKKSDDEKIKQYKEQLEEIDAILDENKRKAKEAIIGEDLKSAINEFATLYAEAWNDGTDAAQKSMSAVKSIISSALTELLKKNIQPTATKFYDALAEAMEDGVLTDVELDNLDAIKKQMDALASKSQEQWEMIQERYRDLDELKEELTDISFDSVRDNFKSLLSDMESTTADFTDSFSDMLRNALLEGLLSEKYDLMLKEWYDEFADKMSDRTLTDSERDALRQQYDAIVQQGLADRDFINSIVGGSAYSQDASKGGWASMGQDTADELNGRFTALTELSAIGNTLTSEGNMLSAQILETLRSMAGLSAVTDGEDSTLREIRDMMFLSTGHLEDIAKYTKQLYDVNSNLTELRNLIDKRL